MHHLLFVALLGSPSTSAKAMVAGRAIHFSPEVSGATVPIPAAGVIWYKQYPIFQNKSQGIKNPESFKTGLRNY